MRIAKIKPNDIANGEGVVVSVWTQGCPHRCKGCHNPETWSFDGGRRFEEQDLNYVLNSLTKNNIHRDLSILGGEPLCSENVSGVFALCKTVKLFRHNTKIYIWTGYLYEDIYNSADRDVLDYVDILIDGKYDESKRNISLKLRGSENQRVIDVKKSLSQGKVVLIEGV